MCLAIAATAVGATYTANFDTDAEGWTGDGAAWVSTGGQDGGYYSGTRNPYAPYLTPPTSSILYGDVASNFDNKPIQFSYYLKDMNGNSQAGGNLYMFAGASNSTIWQWTPGDTSVPTDWKQYSWTVNPAATSAPSGWTRVGGSLSWADSWQDVGYWNFWTDPGTGGAVTHGIDTVRAVSVDPAANAPFYRFDMDITTTLPQGNVPITANIDFNSKLQAAGATGVLDPNSIRVINKTTGQQVPYLRTEDFVYGNSGRLQWVAKDPSHTQYTVQFSAAENRPALIPQEYAPAIGTGDLLRFNAGEPRHVGMTFPARMVDITGDGKLDFVGAWNYAHAPGMPWDGVFCYPGVGDDPMEFGDLARMRYVTSPGSTNYNYFSKIYMTADFSDFNGDGLQDLVYCPSGSSSLNLYLNSGDVDEGGMPVFVSSGSISRGTTTWEPCRAVDLDNNGAMDFVVGNRWLKNTNASQWPIQIGSTQTLNVTGDNACYYDVDGDGWKDAVSLEALPGEPGLSNYRVIWQRNTGGSTPSFATAAPVPGIDATYPTRLAIVDEGSTRGILVTQNHWQDTVFFAQTNLAGEQPAFSNAGTASSLSAAVSASDQAWPSACDWDGDGDLDVLVGGGYGLPRILINEGTAEKMQLTEPQHILSQGEPIRITRNQVFGTDNWHDMGYSYPVYTDWDGDELPDLMMPNETNRIFWYKNIGTRSNPEFGEQQQVICDGYEDSPALRALSASRADNSSYPNNPYPYESEQPFFWRTGVAFADWNGDGLMDMITHDGYTRKATLFTQYEDEGELHLRKDYAIQLTDGRYVDDSIVARPAHWAESFETVDWDGDGLMDIIYGLSSGDSPTIVLLKNMGTATDPVFAPPQTMSLYGSPINITNHGPHPFAGDFDGDGLADLLACTEWSVYPFYNHNALDMSQAPGYSVSGVYSPGELLPGDANADGTVDVTDLGILATHYGASGGMVWTEADFTGDGNVDVSDLGVLATNYGATSASTVPEPSAFVGLLLLCMAGLFRRSAKKRK